MRIQNRTLQPPTGIQELTLYLPKPWSVRKQPAPSSLSREVKTKACRHFETCTGLLKLCHCCSQSHFPFRTECSQRPRSTSPTIVRQTDCDVTIGRCVVSDRILACAILIRHETQSDSEHKVYLLQCQSTGSDVVLRQCLIVDGGRKQNKSKTSNLTDNVTDRKTE